MNILNQTNTTEFKVIAELTRSDIGGEVFNFFGLVRNLILFGVENGFKRRSLTFIRCRFRQSFNASNGAHPGLQLVCTDFDEGSTPLDRVPKDKKAIIRIPFRKREYSLLLRLVITLVALCAKLSSSNAGRCVFNELYGDFDQ